MSSLAKTSATARGGSTPSARTGSADATAKRPGWPVAMPLGLVLPVVLLVLWYVGASSGILKTAIASTPDRVAVTLVDLLTSGVLVDELGATFVRMAWGFGLGLLFGLAAGVGTGYLRTVDRFLDPTLRGLNAVPAVGWIPFLILGFGIGDASKVALITIATFFPIYVNTYAGIRGTDQKLIELALAYRLSRATIMRSIVLPAALPQILVGVRIAVAISWVVATVSEIVYGNSGLGVLLNDGRSLARPDQMVAVMIVLAILGKTSDAIVASLQRRLTSWQSTLDGMPAHRARVLAARGQA
jgi:sulfonate transport system permease protein